MKAYLNAVDQKLAQEQARDILRLEQLIDWKSKVETSLKYIQEELEYLLDTKNLLALQKQLLSARKQNNILDVKTLKTLLDWIRNKYKNLTFMLEEYREFLKIVLISQIDEEVAFKWLDKNEFHPKLDTNMIILMLLKDWKRTNNIKWWKRDVFYSENLVKIRQAMHELDN